MATSRSLGTLTLDLIAKVGGFTKELSKAAREAQDKLGEIEKHFSEFGETVSGILEAVGIGLGIKEIVDQISEAIKSMDELGKSAQKVGLPVEEFSALAAAAQLSNVNVDELQATLGKLSKSEADALDATSQQGKIFAALGISVKDANGNLKSSATVMSEFADRFQQLGTNSTTTAAGIQIFGKSFQDLIPFLQHGSEGINKAKEEAVELGATLSGDAAQAAAQFEDNLTKIQLAGTGVKNQLVQALLPTLNEWTNDIVELAKDHKGLTENANVLADVLHGLAAIGIEVAAGFKVISAAIETVTVAIAADVKAYQLARDAYSHPFDIARVKKNVSEIVSNAKVAREQVGDIWSNATYTLDKYYNAATKQLGEIGQHAKATGKDVADATNHGVKSPQNDAMLKRLQTALDPKSQQNAQALADALANLAEAVTKTGEAADPANKAYNAYADTVRKIDDLGAKAIKAGANVIQVQQLVSQGVDSAQKKLATDLAAPMKAAQAYTDQLQAQYDAQKQIVDAQVAAIGIGTKEAQNQQQLAQVTKQGADALAALQKQYQTHPESMTEAQYNAEYAALKKHNDDMLQLTKDGQDAISAAEADWMNGVNKALQDFIDQQKNTAQIAGQLTSDFLNQGSSALADFINGTKTGKEALKDFINSFEQEITQAIAKQLLSKLFDIGGSGGSGSGGYLGAIMDLFGGGGFGGSGSFFGHANGGRVAAGSVSRVNERGPELLSVGGRDYLMMGDTSGAVTPNNKINRGGSSTTNNFYLAAPTSMKTQSQIANKAAYEMRRASRLS